MTARYAPADIMTCAMARLIRNGEITFVGVNSPMPLAAVALARKHHAPRANFVSVGGGVNPRIDRIIAATSSSELCKGSASIFDNQEVYGLNGRGGIDLTFLGMAQIDAKGRINSSYVGDRDRPKVRFPGGGGAPAILPKAKRAILWRAGHSKNIFVEKVEFVTSQGNLERIVTPLCVFLFKDGELVLDSIHPGVSRDDLADRTGFAIPNLADAPETPEPTDEELSILRSIDPDNVRRIEFGPQ